MQQVAIHTPQNVEIGFPTAELGKRVIAKSIDYIIIIVLFWLVIRIYEGIVGPLYFFRDMWSNRAVFILLFLPVYTYSFWFEVLLRGRTPGKMVMKLQVMRLDGLPYSWENALIRWMFTIIDWLPTMGITGFIAISTTRNGQRLGDLAAGTVLITMKKDEVIRCGHMMQMIFFTSKTVSNESLFASPGFVKVIEEGNKADLFEPSAM